MTLVTVQGSMQLESVTAEAWRGLVSDVRAAHGVTLTITAPAGAYRSPAMVEDMWWSSPERRKRVYGVPLGVGVAKPRSLGGGGSVHESGRCVDISNNSDVPRKSLVAFAAAHGFTFTIGTEPWHIQHTISGGGGSNQEDDMFTDQDRELLVAVKSALLDGNAMVGSQYRPIDVLVSQTMATYQLVKQASEKSGVSLTAEDIAAITSSIPAAPAAEQIAQKVIDFQKLPGN